MSEDRYRQTESRTEAGTVSPAGRSSISGPNKTTLAKRTAGRWKAKLAENLVKFQYKTWGCLVHQANQTGTRRGDSWVSQTNDVFGVFDLVVIEKERPVTFVQVTTDAGLAARKAKIINIVRKHLSSFIAVKIFSIYSFLSHGRVYVHAKEYTLVETPNGSCAWTQTPDDLVFSREAIDKALSRKTTA